MKHHSERVFAFVFFVFFVGCSSEYQEVKITIDDFRFTPSQIYLYAEQPIRLMVWNQGRERHRFNSNVFSDPRINVKWNSERMPSEEEKGISIAPGQRVEATLTLPPGIYTFRCPIRGHRGMNGMLIVEEAGMESSLARFLPLPAKSVVKSNNAETLRFQELTQISREFNYLERR